MNNNDYKEALFYAASIFNERLGTEFGVDNLVLRCFQTENQQEVFEQFCKQYFPDRLTDQYKEDGYFDFHASAFVGKEDGVDGILLRTDIARHPAELKHILLHELAHIAGSAFLLVRLLPTILCFFTYSASLFVRNLVVFLTNIL